MSDATFSGSSQYFARLEAWRSGNQVWGRLTVFKTGGSGYWTAGSVAYGAQIGGVSNDGTWSYDFRNYGSKVVWEWYRDLGPGTWQVNGWADMASGIGRSNPAGVWVTVPPDAPAAPINLSVGRVSDTLQVVNWWDVASPTAPYDDLQVQRIKYNGGWGPWTGMVNGGRSEASGARSWGDSSTQANRIYQYRIKVWNSGGEAWAGPTNWVMTTPAPNPITATLAAGSITLNLTRGVSHGQFTTDIQYSTNGGSTWTALTSLPLGSLSYTWGSPPTASSVVFQARTVNVPGSGGDVGGGLTSAWVTSNTVPLASPPVTPTGLTPNGVTRQLGTTTTFQWQHNPTDSSNQSAYELQRRLVPSTTWTSTGKTSTAVQQYSVTLPSAGTWEWRVRTWGAHPDASPWSTVASVAIAGLPTSNITSPGSSTTTATPTITWTYGASNGSAQVSARVRLVNTTTSETLADVTVPGSVTSWVSTVALTNLTAYRAEVQVTAGNGLVSEWDLQSFTTNFTPPSVPTFSALWNPDQGAVAVQVSNPASGVAVVRNEVLRSVDGGTTWQVAGNVGRNELFLDFTVPVTSGVRYLVRAYTSVGAVATSTVTTLNTNTQPWGYWAASATAIPLVIRRGMGAPPSFQLKAGLAVRQLYYFAGRTLPVEVTGTSLAREGTLAFLVATKGDADQAQALSERPAPQILRLPDGSVRYVSPGQATVTRVAEGWYTVSVPMTEVGA